MEKKARVSPLNSKVKKPVLNITEKYIFSCLSLDPMGIDYLVEKTGSPVHQVLSDLTTLQLKKMVQGQRQH